MKDLGVLIVGAALIILPPISQQSLAQDGPEDDDLIGGADSVESLWEGYVRGVANRNPFYVLRCYEKKLRDEIDRGNPPLMQHMDDLFSLLCRDYESKVVSERKEGSLKVIREMRFVHKKKGDEITAEVVFQKEGPFWYMTRFPAPPGMVTFSPKVIGALVSIGIIAAFVVFFAKKLLG